MAPEAVSPEIAFHVDPAPLESVIVPRPPPVPTEFSKPPVHLLSPPPPRGLENPFTPSLRAPSIPPQRDAAPLRAGAVGFALGVGAAALIALLIWPGEPAQAAAAVQSTPSEPAAVASAPLASDASPSPVETAPAPELETADDTVEEPAATPTPRRRARRAQRRAVAREAAPAPRRASLPAHPSRQDVARAIEAISPRIRACAPEHHGHIANVRFNFVSNGRATSALVPNGFASPRERSCVARAARAARVPAFSESRLQVTYPVRF